MEAQPAEQKPQEQCQAASSKKKAPKPEEPEWIKHRLGIWEELKKAQGQQQGEPPRSPTSVESNIS